MPDQVFSLVPAAYVILLREHTLSPLHSDCATARLEVLLQLRQNTGYMDGHWACGIAGHVEPGESVLATAQREGFEEVGIRLEAGDLIPLTAMHRTNGVPDPIEQRMDMFFTCRAWRGEPRITEPLKCAALRWFPLRALPSPIPPHEATVLSLLATQLDGGEIVPAVTTFGFREGESIALYHAPSKH